MRKPFTWTVAIMCFNEARTLAETVERTRAVVEKLSDDYEILIVDDGSRDGSAELAQRLATGQGRVRALLHGRNKGIGQVLFTAYTHATKDWFSVVPADGEFDPAEFASGVAAAREGKIPCYFLSNSPPFPRPLISFFQKVLNFALFGMWIKRVNWVKILPLAGFDPPSLTCRTPAIETEVMYRLRRNGGEFIWLPSNNAVRNARKGGLNVRGLVRHLLATLLESFALWYRIRIRGQDGKPNLKT
jgi:glycosyltransferase involved in cell wall biosynthesis